MKFILKLKFIYFSFFMQISFKERKAALRRNSMISNHSRVAPSESDIESVEDEVVVTPKGKKYAFKIQDRLMLFKLAHFEDVNKNASAISTILNIPFPYC